MKYYIFHYLVAEELWMSYRLLFEIWNNVYSYINGDHKKVSFGT